MRIWSVLPADPGLTGPAPAHLPGRHLPSDFHTAFCHLLAHSPTRNHVRLPPARHRLARARRILVAALPHGPGRQGPLRRVPRGADPDLDGALRQLPRGGRPLFKKEPRDGRAGTMGRRGQNGGGQVNAWEGLLACLLFSVLRPIVDIHLRGVVTVGDCWRQLGWGQSRRDRAAKGTSPTILQGSRTTASAITETPSTFLCICRLNRPHFHRSPRARPPARSGAQLRRVRPHALGKLPPGIHVPAFSKPPERRNRSPLH